MACKRRKNIMLEAMSTFPEPEEDESVCQLLGSRGGNLMEVSDLPVSATSSKRELAKDEHEDTTKDEAADAGVDEKDAEKDAHTWLCIIPSRFRKQVWMKRGDYVIATRADGKMHGEIRHVLQKPQIQHLRREGLWPAVFEEDLGCEDKTEDSGYADMDLFINGIITVDYPAQKKKKSPHLMRSSS
eukprot:CAMPEP_0177672440 /NCGR_PEP_ID=MMETSP0447-20121125/25341_1 /TAXON_ID=0 /ORGANISM="Stygamoeba regulata, Strain BSH-02190019" /LENGTH=185 /DNA_ID=CAMNT_0019180105 /DNA_START=82 /DNA_END=637 /DNA_ORIENTATION=-